MDSMFKAKIFMKTIAHGLLGIASEILIVALVVVIAFLICMVWWRVF